MRLFSLILFWQPDKGSLGSDQHLMWQKTTAFLPMGNGFWSSLFLFFCSFIPSELIGQAWDLQFSWGCLMFFFWHFPQQSHTHMARMTPQLVTPLKEAVQCTVLINCHQLSYTLRRQKPFYVFLCIFQSCTRIKEVPEIFFKNVLHSQGDVKTQAQ